MKWRYFAIVRKEATDKKLLAEPGWTLEQLFKEADEWVRRDRQDWGVPVGNPGQENRVFAVGRESVKEDPYTEKTAKQKP